MKRVILGCSVFILMGTTAVGQGNLTDAVPADTQQQNQSFLIEVAEVDVVSAEGASIGDIEEVLIDTDGRPASFVVEVGGFLGIAERSVAVPVEAFEFRGGQYVSKMTKRQLENLPAWN